MCGSGSSVGSDAMARASWRARSGLSMRAMWRDYTNRDGFAWGVDGFAVEAPRGRSGTLRGFQISQIDRAAQAVGVDRQRRIDAPRHLAVLRHPHHLAGDDV